MEADRLIEELEDLLSDDDRKNLPAIWGERAALWLEKNGDIALNALYFAANEGISL